MERILQELTNYFGLDPRQSLLNGIESENDDRRVMENTDVLVFPTGDNDDKVNIYESNMWNNATLASLLRNSGVRSRSAGHALTALGLITIFTVQYLYGFSEDFHQSYECSKLANFYSLHCYVLKKCRAYLEEMNYNLVYTVICGLGIAAANTLRKYQNAATRAFQ